MALRIKSIAVAAPSIEQLCTKFAAKLKEAKPDALLWLTDSQQTAAVAKVASRACGASIGARTDAGLIGGGSEFYGPPGAEARVSALAIQNAGAVTPFYSPPEGLPELDDWASLASAPPEQAPPLYLLAAPPANAGFDLESWLARMDSALPWSKKVGGVVCSDRLFLNDQATDGGVVGLAFRDCDMQAVVSQGAAPVGKSMLITRADGNVVRELDGGPVAKALDPVLQSFMLDEPGNLMVGVEVPTAAAAEGGPAVEEDRPYVVRQLLGFDRDASALAIGAAPDLVREGVRIRLHAFSASNARNELANAAERLGGAAGGGLMVPCVGRGPALYGADGVESEALGPSLELAGFFANGEIGPVGGRTFVHTFSTSVGLLRRR